MTLEHGTVERLATQGELLRVLLITGLVAAIIIVAAVAFGWTPTGAPDFGITVDPAGTMPF